MNEQNTQYSVAPYTFISLPEKSVTKYKDIKEVPKRNIFDEKLLSGYIDFNIESKGEIIVKDGSENGEFFKNNKNEYVIPGSTLRGLIRTNAAILSHSNISSEIEDETFSFRSFGKDISSELYRKKLGIKIDKSNTKGTVRTIVENVKAGFIYKKGKNEYAIKIAKEINKNYYFRVQEEDLQYYLQTNKNGINFMYTSDIKKIRIDKSSKEFIMKKSVKKGYKPYIFNKKISFSLTENNHINDISIDNKYSNRGYLLNSNYINKKRAHYIINEFDENKKEIDIKDKNYYIIENYEYDFKRTEKEKNSFFSLPNKEGVENGKPIFFVQDAKGKISIGFTPYLRVPYARSIKDGISDFYKNNDEISYVDAIFGFINKGKNELSLKSRISFEDSICINASNGKEHEYILGEPKASCFKTYLKQDNQLDLKKLKLYEEKFRIRGIKKYWMKNYIDNEDAYNENKNVATKFKTLGKDSVFKGKIRFINLKEDELGLILWALKSTDMAYENIGFAKPYGFGKCEIKDFKLKIENIEKKYEDMSFDFYEDKTQNIEEYKNTYKNTISSMIGKDIESEKSVRELMLLNLTNISVKKKNEFRYMDLTEYKNKSSLPELEKISKTLNIKIPNETQKEIAVTTQKQNKKKKKK